MTAIAPHPEQEQVLEVTNTTCCIVGAGPAGAVLALLLARAGVNVMLLEAHHDFDREFRGDTVHPSVLELMDELGLAERLHQLPHTKLRRVQGQVGGKRVVFGEFARLRTRYPYIMVVPQARFLEFIVREAAKYPAFRLVTGASVRRLVTANGVTQGVRYRARDGWHEVRAALTVACDGRSSKLRRLAGAEADEGDAPMDVLWFRLPRRPDEPHGLFGHFERGGFIAQIDRGDIWQLAFVIRKGTFSDVRAAGLEHLRNVIAQVAPEFRGRVGELTDWSQLSLLSVVSDRLATWHRPGLLFIGDAAHVMSPVGGVGINYAIQDAVVAANVLADGLRAWQRNGLPLPEAKLADVQRRRELPTRFIQAIQQQTQRRILAPALRGDSLRLPMWVRVLTRVPLVRGIAPRVIGIGLWRVHVRNKRA